VIVNAVLTPGDAAD